MAFAPVARGFQIEGTMLLVVDQKRYRGIGLIII